MAKIDPKLIQALMSKLDIGRSQAYAKIAKVANTRFLEPEHAALVVAQEAGLNPRKFSTAAQRAGLRSQGAQPIASEQIAGPVRTAQAKGKGRPAKPTDRKSVFVVHGRDANLRKEMFIFLRSLGLRPLEWGTAIAEAKRGANPNVEAVIDACMAKVQAVVVLFSPDEEVRLVEGLRSSHDGDKFELQPRPNVIFEAGLALGRHPEKTLLIEVGDVRGFSDIAGRHMARLDGSLEARNDVISRLRILNCLVETSGSDGLSAGSFK